MIHEPGEDTHIASIDEEEYYGLENELRTIYGSTMVSLL